MMLTDEVKDDKSNMKSWQLMEAPRHQEKDAFTIFCLVGLHLYMMYKLLPDLALTNDGQPYIVV